MSVRNLDRLFKPRSIALVGASKRPNSVGAVVARNLFNAGFDGPIMPLHPRHEAIEGVLTHNSVAELPRTPDLAVIATPPDTVPGLIAELGARGTKAVVVITAGFAEGGEAGARRLTAMLEAAQPHTLRIVGPNCLGVMVPGVGMNAGFSHIAPLKGDLAFVTQSGAMVTAMLDWATPRGIGFSHVVSLGGMADVDFGDMLDYLAVDPETRAILLYIEAVTHARKFMSAARAAARTKPVIVIKGGRHAEGASAVASHTGALAGADEVYDAAFARAGMLRVTSLDELFDAAETLAMAPRMARRLDGAECLSILTNGGGLGVLATDTLIDEGGHLTALAPETLAALDKVLPPTWSHGNPVDIIGDAPGERYAAALEALIGDPGSDAILILNCPTAIASSSDAARAVVEVLERHDRRSRPPVITAWLGEAAAAEARGIFARHRIPSFDTPERAVRAVAHLVRYRRHQNMLMETPPTVPGRVKATRQAARTIIEDALAERKPWLSEPDAKAVLAAYGIPVVESQRARTPDEAAAAAEAIGRPVVLKILSPDVLHKSDVGGVVLDLDTPEEVRRAAEAMLRRVELAVPGAVIEGFVVEELHRRPGAQELILGIVEDAQFGPVILFGQGGTAVEVIKDKALALPPLNMNLARALIAETRVHRLLEGYRDQPPANLEAIQIALINLAQLAIDFAEVVEVDINPLLADAEGVVALDARIKVAPARLPGAARLAIRPYPKDLEETLTLPDGGQVLVRPIRPEDAPALRRGFKKLDQRHVRLRFFTAMSELSSAFAARLTQIDYDREMALVALDPAPSAEPDGWGVARIAADPDNARAEFALIVRSDKQGHGLGSLLMKRILAYAESRGIGEIWGDVLAENDEMLGLAKKLGFSSKRLLEEPGAVRVTKTLGARSQSTGDGS